MPELKHWLDLYATSVHDWHQQKTRDGVIFYRRQGIVENMFDSDGIDHEGRADLCFNLNIELRTRLDEATLRERIVLVWSLMRHRHALLAAKSLYGKEFLSQAGAETWLEKYFVYTVPANGQTALQDARATSVFLDAGCITDNGEEFKLHLMNTARVVIPTMGMSKLFVLPMHRTDHGTWEVPFIFVAGHSIADGLTTHRWSTDFIRLLNRREEEILDGIDQACTAAKTQSRLPPCQEALYPSHGKTLPQLRWNWAITRILRHVRKPPPAAFQNPLWRDELLPSANDLPHTYPKYLDYGRKPPLNCFTMQATLSRRATSNLIRLCREARISIGSGSFTLAGLAMMRFEELRDPTTPHWQRLPFVGSFPVNPRPFLEGDPTTGKEDSMMLAFSDGVTLPFVPSHFDLRKSFRVLGRLAHRQLRQYQKKARTPEQELELGSRSPRQLLPTLYLSTMERMNDKVKPHQRVDFHPQGCYPASQNFSRATCGISSVGDTSSLTSSGMADIDELGDHDVVADFRFMQGAVRAREGEFLVGASGTRDTQSYNVSYDGSAIDPRKVEAWKKMIQEVLEFDMDKFSKVLPTKL